MSQKGAKQMQTRQTLATVPFPIETLDLLTDATQETRAEAYEFLAGIFLKEPSADILASLREWAQASSDQEGIALLDEISANDPSTESLKQEYYDLFFVPVSGRFVPPYESAITAAFRREGKKTKFGSFCGSETVEVSNLYERAEFHPEKLIVFEPLSQINLPDHLGFELSFMAYLCRLEGEQENLGLSTSGIRHLQASFLTRHLNRWLSLFIEDLNRVEQSGYYHYFARIAQALCEEEASLLSEHTPITPSQA